MMLYEMKDIRKELHGIYSKTAHPHIIAYALISGAAGAVPVPFVDIPVVTLVQAKRCCHEHENFSNTNKPSIFAVLGNIIKKIIGADFGGNPGEQGNLLPEGGAARLINRLLLCLMMKIAAGKVR